MEHNHSVIGATEIRVDLPRSKREDGQRGCAASRFKRWIDADLPAILTGDLEMDTCSRDPQKPKTGTSFLPPGKS